jgi:hypothetical protein
MDAGEIIRNMNAKTATWNREDRDLLVELRTTLGSVQNDITEIKNGTAAKLQFLEADKLSRAEAVRLSTENLSQHTDFTERIANNAERITDLEESRIEYRATIKSWLIMVGIVQFLFGVGFALYLHYY